MATSINSIVSVKSCAGASTYGTGNAHCKFDFKNMAGGSLLILKKGTPITNIDLSSLTTDLIKPEKLIPINGVVNVTPENSDNQNTTYSSGIEVAGTPGLAKYRIDFDNGHLFHKVLASLAGQNKWEVILVDAAGNAMIRRTVQGEVRGFSTSLFQTNLPTMINGGDAPTQSISFQMSNRDELDRQLDFLDTQELENIGVSLKDLPAINSLEISLDAVSDGATSITGKIVSPFDGTLTHSTAAIGDFTFTGVVPTAATVSDAGVLTLTVPAVSTDDVITAKLNGVVEDADGVLFKSNTAKVVVTA